jgi:hypothetical protein
VVLCFWAGGNVIGSANTTCCIIDPCLTQPLLCKKNYLLIIDDATCCVAPYERPPYSDKHKSMLLDLSKYRYSLMLLFPQYLWRFALYSICVGTCATHHVQVACATLPCGMLQVAHATLPCGMLQVAHATLPSGRCASGICHTALWHVAVAHATLPCGMLQVAHATLPCGMLHVAHASSLMTIAE